MKNLLTIMIAFASLSTFAIDCRALTELEKSNFNKQACLFFKKVAYNLKVDVSLCEKSADFKFCQQETIGDYIYGKINYSSSYEAKDCNFLLEGSKITSLDCGDE